MLEERFKSASAYMASRKDLKLSTATKLAIYADYKLATEGECTQPRPSLLEFEKSAKWKAWKETGEKYSKEIKTSSSSVDSEDSAQASLSTKAMVSYIQRVEDGQWGWNFENTLTDATISTTGDRDLDELEAYLGVDTNEISAEELLARPYVPIEGGIEGANMTASGISTLSIPEDEVAGDDKFDSAKTGSLDSLKAALSANPNLATLKDEEGLTMLHWACDRGYLEKVKYLVKESKADVNAQDEEGSTPLHYACLSAWPEIISYLKSLPIVDKTIKDNSGMTAEEYLD